MNIILKEIEIKNFRGIENYKQSFTNKLNIISGKNGIGKTSILNAIVYGITGKVITGSSTNIERKNIDGSIAGELFIKLKLMKDSEEIIIVNNNKKSFIVNDFTLKNMAQFIQYICKILKINNIDNLFNSMNPTYLEEHLNKKDKDNQEIRKWIINNVNSKFNNNFFEEDDYTDLVEKEKELSQKIKDYKKEKKDIEYRKNIFEEENDINHALNLSKRTLTSNFKKEKELKDKINLIKTYKHLLENREAIEGTIQIRNNEEKQNNESLTKKQ